MKPKDLQMLAPVFLTLINSVFEAVQNSKHGVNSFHTKGGSQHGDLSSRRLTFSKLTSIAFQTLSSVQYSKKPTIHACPSCKLPISPKHYWKKKTKRKTKERPKFYPFLSMTPWVTYQTHAPNCL